MLDTTEVRNIKDLVISRVFHGEDWTRAGKGRVRGVSWPHKDKITHVRFHFTNAYDPRFYQFNINRNTLTSEYALWICGSEADYFLLPIKIIKLMYEDPNVYRQPVSSPSETPIVSILINIRQNAVNYIVDGKTQRSIAYNLSAYKGGTL